MNFKIMKSESPFYNFCYFAHKLCDIKIYLKISTSETIFFNVRNFVAKKSSIYKVTAIFK